MWRWSTWMSNISHIHRAGSSSRAKCRWSSNEEIQDQIRPFRIPVTSSHSYFICIHILSSSYRLWCSKAYKTATLSRNVSRNFLPLTSSGGDLCDNFAFFFFFNLFSASVKSGNFPRRARRMESRKCFEIKVKIVCIICAATNWNSHAPAGELSHRKIYSRHAKNFAWIIALITSPGGPEGSETGSRNQ